MEPNAHGLAPWPRREAGGLEFYFGAGEFAAADAIRAQFGPLAGAVINPYLAADPELDSTDALSDDFAAQLPQAIQTFLPEAQRLRLVRAVAFTCLS